jgi:23S rRNA pseudouridine955/2504/2580 synthase
VDAPVSAAPATPFTLLEVTIKTGRTIRFVVHLAGEGQPIAGDDMATLN